MRAEIRRCYHTQLDDTEQDTGTTRRLVVDRTVSTGTTSPGLTSWIYRKIPPG